MNAKELINVLMAFGFTPEEYAGQLYPHGSYDTGSNHYDNEKIESVTGAWEEKEKEKEVHIEQYGYTETTNRTVLYFPKHDVYIGAHIFSGSYGTETWTDWYELKPQQVTTYMKVEEQDDNSY